MAPAGDVAAVTREVGARRAVHGDGHFTVENNVRGETVMRVVGIESVWGVLPDKSVGETLSFESLAKFALA